MARDRVNVIDYYRDQAVANGLAPTATMPDAYVVDAEISAIRQFLWRATRDESLQRLLEIGCGNGHLATVIHHTFGGRFDYCGIDYTPEMIELAKSRKLPFRFDHASVLELPIPDGGVDLIVSDRVLINLLEVDDQLKAVVELARVLRRGGVMMMIEGFKEGLVNLNRARSEFLLNPIPEPAVNNWFTEQRWAGAVMGEFVEFGDAELVGLPPQNFLSSHYFMTRFVHDAIRPADSKIRNTEFAKFFALALPPVGDYSPLRIKYLRRV
jgi:ubiquinone/menaquinone biosynthesis C-methylase UbiE